MWPTTLEQPHFVSCAAATLMSLSSLSLSLSLCLALPRTHLSLTHSHFWTLSLFVRLSHTFSLLSVSAHPDLSNINDDDDDDNDIGNDDDDDDDDENALIRLKISATKSQTCERL